MRHWLLPLNALVVAVVVVGAEPAALEPSSAAEKLRLFQRNRPLVEMLVEGGLKLAALDDPLERGACCAEVAQQLAEEVRQAARRHEGFRAAELGQHLHRLLEDGVAPNLQAAAGPDLHPESQGYRKLLALSEQVDVVMQPLEEDLRRLTDPDAQEDVDRLRRALSESRAEVKRLVERPHRLTKEAQQFKD